jgi:hypothetical protein
VELCAIGGITLDDFTLSVAYREIFGRTNRFAGGPSGGAELRGICFCQLVLWHPRGREHPAVVWV